MLDGIIWLLTSIASAFYNFAAAILQAPSWLGWLMWDNSTEDKQALMRFIYYGGSTEFFFVLITTFLVLLGVGFWRNSFMWGCVQVMEGFANTIGRGAAWAGLLMVLQQIIIIFSQRIFARAEISIGFGISFHKDIRRCCSAPSARWCSSKPWPSSCAPIWSGKRARRAKASISTKTNSATKKPNLSQKFTKGLGSCFSD